jgi:signal transduction histidine kinase/ActR/RegA family two-component response regulator
MTAPLDGSDPVLEFQAGYGYEERRHLSTSYRLGEGLVGQCAKERKRILLTDVPSDYVRISSGLGDSPPLNIIVLPIVFEGAVRAVLELASFSAFSATHQAFLDQLPESIGLVFNTIAANTRTETLLEQSLSLAEELRESNEDLGRQARLLAERNLEAEQKNLEVERSKALVEEKAGELTLSSQYKSEFIANMSHELRTPLNSLLILAQQLEENPDRNLTDAQVEYASVIRSSGMDLMALLNGVLDLAKVESGTVVVDTSPLSLAVFGATLLSEFEQVARSKGISIEVDVAPECPGEIVTDPQRLHQILKNLIANAVKFTEHGGVRVDIGVARDGWSQKTDGPAENGAVLELSVKDTGIGIDEGELERIFEPFSQGDGSIARLYGGTGLGLSISRELVGLLGGEITVSSAPGQGSTFTVRVPMRTVAAPDPRGWIAEHPDLQPHRPRPSGDDAYAYDGTKVLVVDDDYRNIFAMTALLERGHAEVTAAESGTDAIAILELHPDVDVVLMDIMMPVMDGYATMRAIRAIEGLSALPIIAVTGKVVGGERQRCLDAGANDYVPKPVDTAELFAALRPWLPAARAGAAS